MMDLQRRAFLLQNCGPMSVWRLTVVSLAKGVVGLEKTASTQWSMHCILHYAVVVFDSVTRHTHSCYEAISCPFVRDRGEGHDELAVVMLSPCSAVVSS